MSAEDIKELLKVNKEMLMWIKFANISKVKEVLEEVLKEPEKKMVYHLSDGTIGRKIIAKRTGVGETTVTTWWSIWYKLGIAEPISVQRGNRGKKVFELNDYGIKVPSLQKLKKEEKTQEKVTLT